MSKPAVDNASNELSRVDAAELEIVILGIFDMLDMLEAAVLGIVIPGIVDVLMLAYFLETKLETQMQL